MLKQIEEMKELGIPCIIVYQQRTMSEIGTKDNVVLLIREAKYKRKFSEDSGGLFGQKVP